METLNKKRGWCLQWNSRWIALYLLLYFLINLSFLTKFPIMHSDEAWLSGLTRTMMEQGTLNTTEPFFTLKPRYPHGLKILFHLLQMPLSLLYGYRLFAFRLLSLLVSIASLWVFHKILCRYLPEPSYRFLCLSAFSLSAQYLYASHFARQEILILFLMLLVYLFLEQGKVGLAALVTGLSAGVHPNGFLIAAWREGCSYAICY